MEMKVIFIQHIINCRKTYFIEKTGGGPNLKIYQSYIHPTITVTTLDLSNVA